MKLLLKMQVEKEHEIGFVGFEFAKVDLKVSLSEPISSFWQKPLFL